MWVPRPAARCLPTLRIGDAAGAVVVLALPVVCAEVALSVAVGVGASLGLVVSVGVGVSVGVVPSVVGSPLSPLPSLPAAEEVSPASAEGLGAGLAVPVRSCTPGRTTPCPSRSGGSEPLMLGACDGEEDGSGVGVGDGLACTGPTQKIWPVGLVTVLEQLAGDGNGVGAAPKPGG